MHRGGQSIDETLTANARVGSRRVRAHRNRGAAVTERTFGRAGQFSKVREKEHKMACAAQSDSVHRMAAELRDMPQITNQHSAKGIEMTAYDEQRQFHAPIEDDTEVVAAPRALQSELCCPICLDLLTNTMTTKVRLYCRDS